MNMFDISKQFIVVLTDSLVTLLSSEPMIYFVAVILAFSTLGLLLKLIR